MDRSGVGLVTDIQASAEHKAVVEFLRGKNGPKVRRGVLNGKRVDYFKGEQHDLSSGVSSSNGEGVYGTLNL